MNTEGRIQIIETSQQRQQRLERIRQHDIRSNTLVPIYVMWTSGVPQREAHAAVAGVANAVDASRQDRKVVVLGSVRFGQGEYGSADWYVEEAYRRQSLRRNIGHGLQVVSSQIMGLFHEEPWQTRAPHWEVMLINQDLTDYHGGHYLNFVFGSTDTSFPASVQSVRRLEAEVQDLNLRDALTQRVIEHEVGHMFGLPGRNQRVVENLGTHCINVCVMRQGLSTDEWIQQLLQERQYRIRYCGDCHETLERNSQRFLR